ncbi:DsbA family protein [Zoogloea oleivorans]|uniref:DsbA family protein n=1 Tax=Zoogloea oleivorans TaxID=1552750 RepID=UPI0011E01C6D|nr:DsbA family protein [Zoogloea oleivorans]
MTTSESSPQAIFYFDVISPWACIQGDPGLDSPAMQAAANVRFGAARLDGLSQGAC